MAIPPREVGGKTLPEVLLPKSRYKDSEQYVNGPRKGQKGRSFAELTEDEVAAVEASPQIREMISKGFYRWIPKIPERMKSKDEIIDALKAENEALKAKLGATGAGGTA
jgi:hypothetical protein